MNIDALIQVRMGSGRLPGKALLQVDGIAVLERVLNNLKPSKYIRQSIICTTQDPSDDALEDFGKAKNVPVFRGEAVDVVKRFHQAACHFGSDVIVRATGDCPALSAEAADILIKSHLETKADYTSIEAEAAPVGAFPQIIGIKALERLAAQALDFNYSEYMVYYFINNPKLFSLNIVPAPAAYRHPQFRLTLDYKEDLEMFDAFFKQLRQSGMDFSLTNALHVLRQNPDIARINAHLAQEYRNIYDGLMDKIAKATVI